MQLSKILSAIFIYIGCSVITVANADDKGPVLSFSQPDTYQNIEKSVDMLSAWARGEYVEHKSLFAKYPKDDAVIKSTMTLIEEFKQLSKQAKKSGDENKALAYLFSAEATARYAARMPHMLEERIEKTHP